MNWRNYTVSIDTGSLASSLAVTIRAISTRDAEYVATTPCKRNGGKPIVREGESIISIKPED